MGPIRDMLASSGVNEQKWRILRVLQEQGPLELSQVASEACLLLSSLTRMVRPMEDEGLIVRSTPPEDRRKTVVAITAAGERLVRAHSGQSQAIFEQIELQFGAERLEQLLDLLQDLQSLDLRGPPHVGTQTGPGIGPGPAESTSPLLSGGLAGISRRDRP